MMMTHGTIRTRPPRSVRAARRRSNRRGSRTRLSPKRDKLRTGLLANPAAPVGTPDGIWKPIDDGVRPHVVENEVRSGEPELDAIRQAGELREDETRHRRPGCPVGIRSVDLVAERARVVIHDDRPYGGGHDTGQGSPDLDTRFGGKELAL